MKIVITSTGQSPDSPIDQRFGRASYFTLFDTETDKWDVINNTIDTQASHGAGVQSAQKIINTGARLVITGSCGPKAFTVLEAAGIEIYVDALGTSKDAVAALQASELTRITGASVESGYGSI